MRRPAHSAFAFLFGLWLLLPSVAGAAPILIIQEWRDPLFGSNGQSLRTGAIFDDTGITGSGTEDVLLTELNVFESEFGIGQNANYAQFSVPPSFSIEGNVFARYVDGNFVRLQSVDLGGSALTTLLNMLDDNDYGARFSVGAGGAFYGLALSLNQYDLHSTNITVIPEPGTLPLVAAGIGWLAARCRKRRTEISD